MRSCVVAFLALILLTARADAQCTADGGTSCGTFCHPANRVCCSDVGHPELSCMAGLYCKDTGSGIMCAQQCVSPQLVCGNGCYDPSMSSCCADVGHPEYTCPKGHHCISTSPFCESDSSDPVKEACKCAVGLGAKPDVPYAAAFLLLALLRRRRRSS